MLTAHIVASVGLLGEVSGFLAVAVRAAASDDPAFTAAAYDLLAMFSLIFGIPLSFTTLGTGLLLGLGGKWGVFRYPWVTIKLGLIVTVILVGATVLGPSVDAMRDGDGDVAGRIVAGAAWNVAALLVATGLSVYRPGRARRALSYVIRRRRRAAGGPTTGARIGRTLWRTPIKEPTMAAIIDNPVTGERITFLSNDGERLAFELELAADGRVPGAHVHPEQEERFHVLEGTMRFRLGLRRIVAEAGDTVVVPAGRVHKFANAGDGPARARVEVVPALDMEELLRTTAELAHEGNVLRSGMPRPLHLALFVRRFRREVRAPFPPAWVVRAVLAPLAALGRRRGHDARYAYA